ncbi:Serine/threonine protein kinase [hydrothermal vent metagenome]|uniref:Serine/threonine protein kinase n=1 Tax=hydrothermal vent metagenome TaxID=652676 RepID=A0A3B1D3N5_9ZZZZ
MKQEDGTTYPEYLETTQPRTIKQNMGHSSFTEETATPALSEKSHHAKKKSITEKSITGQPASSTFLPEKFGRYTVKKFLGEGTMGSVYLAEDNNLKRQVALKTPLFTGDNPELLERFYREARSAATLNNKNICTVFDAGEINNIHYISMEYIEGRPLSDFIHPKKPQSPSRIAKLIYKLAMALQEAHKVGVVHRDLKPDNIMVDTKGEPVITDFGLAYQTESLHDRMTLHEGAIMGTPAYMAPEQVRGEQKKVGPQSDQYSLGVVLYEMLCGQRPFSGSIGVVMSQILTENPVSPIEFYAEADLALQSICLKMMQKEQANRYGSMKEVANALAKYLKQPANINHKNSVQKTGDSNNTVQDDVATFSVLQTTLSPQKKERGSKTHAGKKKKNIYRIATALFGILLLTGLFLLSQSKATFKPVQKVIKKKKVSLVTTSLSDPRLKKIAVSAPILPQGEPGEAIVFQYHSKPVTAVCFSSDGNFFAAASMDGLVSIWEFSTGKLSQSFWIENLVPSTVQFSKDAQKVLVGYRTGEIRIWNRISGEVVHSFIGEKYPMTQVIYSPDEKIIASASNSFRSWNISNESELSYYSPKHGAMQGGAIAFLSNEHILVSTEEGVRMFDVKSGKQEHNFELWTGIKYLSVSPDKKKILLSSKKRLEEWGFVSREKIASYPKAVSDTSNIIQDFLYFPDGRHLAVITNKRVCSIWSTQTGKKIASYKTPNSKVNCLAVEPKGRFLLMGVQRKTKSLDENSSIEPNRCDLHIIRMPSDVWSQ